MFLEAGPNAARIGFGYAKECVEEFAGITKGTVLNYTELGNSVTVCL